MLKEIQSSKFTSALECILIKASWQLNTEIAIIFNDDETNASEFECLTAL